MLHMETRFPFPALTGLLPSSFFAVQGNGFCTFQVKLLYGLVKTSKNAPDGRTCLHVEALHKRLESELIAFLASTSSLVSMTAANKNIDFARDCRTF